MQFSRDGAQQSAGGLPPDALAELEVALTRTGADRPGTRLSGIAPLSKLLCGTGPVGHLAATQLGPKARPVRAVLFNKTADHNWALGWHQDRTIAVRERVEAPGFRNWTVKSGLLHVEPPFEILERMITLRIHIDAAGPNNAPLLIAPGSHRLGRIAESRISETVDRVGSFTCLASRGDIWLYATPILHASEAAAEPASRRVLQVDYSAEDLPAGLSWSGV